ncbi:Do family serine endopeptidase [candidate division KSB1 bacterium]
MFSIKMFNNRYITLPFLFFLVLVVSSEIYGFQSDNVKYLRQFSEAFTEVSEMVSPAVVSIESVRKVTATSRESFPREYRDFFDRINPRSGEDREFFQRGMGSGVIISRDGYILTNNHVVEDSDTLIVRLKDKRKYLGVLVGRDPLTDVALIKVEGKDLPTAKLGNSDDVKTGEWVLAIGTPFTQNLNHSVTAGIVSAVGRNLGIITGDFNIEDFIQTDAAINPGNSGGPLVNLNGEVIGINTAIVSNTGTYQGYGFAIPSNLVSDIADDLRKYGKVVRGVIGISFREIADHEEMKELKLENPYGVRILEYPENFDDSPGMRAGIKVDDVVIAINDRLFSRAGQLQSTIASKNPGDRVKLTVMRDGKKMDFWVTLGEMPEEETPQHIIAADNYEVPEIGVKVEENIYADRRNRNAPRGVMITSVTNNSQAFEKNIEVGDIIFKIESTDINSLADFQRAIEEAKGNSRVLFYIRNEKGTSLISFSLR